MMTAPKNDAELTAKSKSGAARDEFKQELLTVIPHLRAFARSLTGRADLADDLVQETLLKAWAARDRYAPGTRMKSWTFVILRNSYLTILRRRSEEHTSELQSLMRISYAVFCLKKKKKKKKLNTKQKVHKDRKHRTTGTQIQKYNKRKQK